LTNTLSSNPKNLNPSSASLSSQISLEKTNDIEHPLDLTNSNPGREDFEMSKLSINENSSNLPAVPANNNTKHGLYLAFSDHDRIKTFISEFLQRGLVPYAERTIKILNEQNQSKKSILKSFGIPRKLFGGSSSTTTSPSISISSASKSAAILSASTAGYSNSALNSSSNTSLTSSGTITLTNNFIASNDELHIRRLADLAFMFRLYDLAFNSYHSAKKEFTNILSQSGSGSSSEQIVNMKMYLAGALEMSTVASFMQNFANDLLLMNNNSSLPISASNNSLSSLAFGSSSNKTYSLQYIDEAINLYLNECKNMFFSVRSVLLSTEALKATGLYLKAAYQFINLSNDETDVRTALFLEQAALCYLAQPQSLIRKYAFFMSLAGHRFNKAGQVFIFVNFLTFPTLQKYVLIATKFKPISYLIAGLSLGKILHIGLNFNACLNLKRNLFTYI
jgi:hypothetical protein